MRTESTPGCWASQGHHRVADEDAGLLEAQDLDEVFGEPELNPCGDVEDDSHGEGPHEVHFGLEESADHVAELVLFFVAWVFLLLL